MKIYNSNVYTNNRYNRSSRCRCIRPNTVTRYVSVLDYFKIFVYIYDNGYTVGWPVGEHALIVNFNKKKRFQGKMYACERDPERQNTLHNIIKLAGARVEVIAKDVFEIKKGMMDDVEYILLDPSCSGSGNWLQ